MANRSRADAKDAFLPEGSPICQQTGLTAMPQALAAVPGAYAHSTASTSAPPTPSSALSKRSNCSSSLSSPKRPAKRRRRMDPRTDGRNHFEEQTRKESEDGAGGIFARLWTVFTGLNLGGGVTGSTMRADPPPARQQARGDAEEKSDICGSGEDGRALHQPDREPDDEGQTTFVMNTLMDNLPISPGAKRRRRPMFDVRAVTVFGWTMLTVHAGSIGL